MKFYMLIISNKGSETNQILTEKEIKEIYPFLTDIYNNFSWTTHYLSNNSYIQIKPWIKFMECTDFFDGVNNLDPEFISLGMSKEVENNLDNYFLNNNVA